VSHGPVQERPAAQHLPPHLPLVQPALLPQVAPTPSFTHCVPPASQTGAVPGQAMLETAGHAPPASQNAALTSTLLKQLCPRHWFAG
jgi:hypothetical protein